MEKCQCRKKLTGEQKCGAFDICITYLRKAVCLRCWAKHGDNPDKLKQLLGLAAMLIVVCLLGCNQKILDKRVWNADGDLIEHVHFGQTSVAYWSVFNNASMTNDPNGLSASVGAGEQKSDPESIKAISAGVADALKLMVAP